MEALVKLSFYCFAASSIALGAAALSYVVFSIGRVRVKRATLATSAGTTVSASRAEFGPSPLAAGRFGTMLTSFGAVFAFLAVLFRSIAAERLPTSNMFEFSLTFVLAISVIYLIFERMYGIRQLGAIVISLAFLMTVYIWSLPAEMREVDPLIPALQARPIMTAHVSSAILSYATFAVSFAAAVMFLIKHRWNVSWLPATEVLDDVGFRAVTVGFPLLSLVLILGSVWAHDAWGVYWSWDPKETAALFTWLVYAVYLHTRTLRGWRGSRSAVVLLVGFAAVMFTYYGNYFFGGLHAYGGV
ncbi:MAG: Cytochrome c-type biogenesis protein CcsA/ResC [uncultured Thermomicrobiales bacterium]|uniref:Cytochrome c-type biogenesis protein CcsA/ResC n=1 Tax=uncultured Thermomicrobiales bacterium TaxID=1645740 RepID=A0A6J4URJ5_9BACT|nr:MAG: Cytochrome c-type biogenesis protein CcsA/ResC [uncultured Thermomicrobiales bacterium]